MNAITEHISPDLFHITLCLFTVAGLIAGFFSLTVVVAVASVFLTRRYDLLITYIGTINTDFEIGMIRIYTLILINSPTYTCALANYHFILTSNIKSNY